MICWRAESENEHYSEVQDVFNNGDIQRTEDNS